VHCGLGRQRCWAPICFAGPSPTLAYCAVLLFVILLHHRHCRITKQYKETLNPDLVCMGEQQQTQWWLLVAGCVVVTLVLVVYRAIRGSDDDNSGTMSGASSRRTSMTDRLSAINAARGPSPHYRGF
jgi:hypothetical protein